MGNHHGEGVVSVTWGGWDGTSLLEMHVCQVEHLALWCLLGQEVEVHSFVAASQGGAQPLYLSSWGLWDKVPAFCPPHPQCWPLLGVTCPAEGPTTHPGCSVLPT